MYHVDWLTLAQQHDPRDTPEYGDGWVLQLSPDGECEWVSARSVGHEDSYSHSVRVRSHGGLVEWSGNPSRWDRLDNVWGIDFATALGLVNSQLTGLGLPVFDSIPRGQVNHYERFGSDAGSRLADRMADVGAVVRRVDLARNFGAGPEYRAVIRALAQGVWHGRPASPGGDASISWGSRRSTFLKCYDKAAEMRSHRAPQVADESEWHEAVEYRRRLAEWCETVGLVRWEMQLGRDGLRRHALRDLREWTEGDGMSRVVDIAEGARERVWPSVGLGGLAGIADELQGRQYRGRPVSAAAARTAQGLAYQWAAGVDVFGAVAAESSQATAYRYRALLKLVGIDIRKPQRDVMALRVQPRVVEMTPVEPPDWYRAAV